MGHQEEENAEHHCDETCMEEQRQDLVSMLPVCAETCPGSVYRILDIWAGEQWVGEKICGDFKEQAKCLATSEICEHEIMNVFGAEDAQSIAAWLQGLRDGVAMCSRRLKAQKSPYQQAAPRWRLRTGRKLQSETADHHGWIDVPCEARMDFFCRFPTREVSTAEPSSLSSSAGKAPMLGSIASMLLLTLRWS